MKFFKNKFFITFLAIALFITIFTTTVSAMGINDPVKNIVNAISMPFRYVIGTVEGSIEGYLKYFSTIDQLDAENEKLKDKVEALESQLAEAEAVKQENERLKEYLEIKETYPGFEFVESLIIGSEADSYTTVVTLNKGSGQGIEIGMPVIVKSGLVGSVCEVGSNWCRVRLITEPSSSVGVYIPRSGEAGILEGDISFKDACECKLSYLSADADIASGDLVYTSGIGSVYPEGLYIGRIKSVSTDQNLRTKTATVELSVNFEELKYLLIITGNKESSDG